MTQKVYKFKDKSKLMTYEELVKLENVLSNKILLGGNIMQGTQIDNDVILGDKLVSVYADAFNTDGNFINDVINARMDTSTKKILSDFDFGTTDYAGAVKSGTIAWNTSTGAITGGSGVALYRKGIVAANAGSATFSLDATTGNATFAGTLSAPNGTLGTITSATITAGSFQTATSGQRVTINSAGNDMQFYNSSGSRILSFGTSATIIMSINPINDDLSGLFLQNSSDLTLTETLFTADVQKNSSSATTAVLKNAGSGDVLEIGVVSTGSGDGIEINYAAPSGVCLDINKTGTSGGNVVDISNAGTGYTFYANQSNSSNSSNLIYGINAGTGRTLELIQSNGSNTSSQAYISNAGSGYTMELLLTNVTSNYAPLYLFNSSITSTNFKRGMVLNNTTIWTSDTTTPNGNLSGQAGDICLNGDSGNIYRCTGTTNWTAM